MTLWKQWIHHPQALWVRKAVFQVHLWVGIAVGIYVLTISVSGSAIVYRREIAGKYLHRTVVVTDAGRRRMSEEEQEQNVKRVYPKYEVLGIRQPEERDRPDDVVLERRNIRVERLFDPYTGKDLGNPQPAIDQVLEWLADLHDNLLLGVTGRFVNGIGSILVTLLSLTGAVIWWPGIKNWRRSLTINRKARFARFNWDLHSAIGFWCSSFVFVWGISGICLCFPETFDSLADGQLGFWLTRLHFGRFNSLTEVLWTSLGLAPAVLAGTGALMWWNRVVRKKIRRSANGIASTLKAKDKLSL
jgi:uncharacterized iron-regulated membrane protein